MKNLSQIEEIYHAALEHPPEKRRTFLQRACETDPELLREVESLLASYESAGDFFEQTPEDLAADFLASRQTSDLVGKQFNEYRVLSKLGEGGMGEVYLAEDTRLGRKVALKLLPLQFSSDAERKNRFAQEARAVSALNHPNIITIHGIEKSDEFNLITTEYIEGQTLKEKIGEGKINWQEAVKIGIQIAGALESAHSVGIIHRDIKPANIMIRRDGIVKVLDFGLAKLIENSEARVKAERTAQAAGRQSGKSQHTNPNTELTTAGAIMGTVNYMSPEQARGEKVDERSDIFSFGVILYEMLAGAKPFAGNTDEESYEATIKRNPFSLNELNPKLPAALNRIVTRAIEKKPENRYQTISELKAELQKLEENSGQRFIASSFKFLVAATTIILLSAAIYFAFLRNSSAPKSEIKISNYTQLTTQSGEELFPNLSPDGKSLLYVSGETGNQDIYLKKIGETEAVNLTKDSADNERQAVFSPDGKEIAFRSERLGGGIFVMNAKGENIRQLTDSGFYPNWSPDGREIVFCLDDFNEPVTRTNVPSQLWAVETATGKKRLITEQDAVQPNWSPGGRRIAFWGLDEGGNRDIRTISAEGGEPLAVTSDAAIDWDPVWSPDGKYLFFVSNKSGSMNLWRVPIDENSGRTAGDPEPVTIPSNYAQFLNFPRQGGNSFAYVQSVNYSNIFKIDFDERKESVTGNAVEITRGSKITTNPEISADNQFIAFDAIGEKQEDIFSVDGEGRNLKQLTNDIYRDRAPRWSPDGKRIAFFSDITGKYEAYLMNADGSNKRLAAQMPGDRIAQLAVWSPDGKRLLYSTSNKYPVILDPDKTADEQTLQFLPDEGSDKKWFLVFSWSADGKKLAGSGIDLEKNISYLMTFDFASNKYEVVSNVGARPFWLADSRRLIFYSGDKIYLLDTVTKKKKELLSVAPYRLQSISIARDNRSILYTVQKRESDIWLAKVQ